VDAVTATLGGKRLAAAVAAVAGIAAALGVASLSLAARPVSGDLYLGKGKERIAYKSGTRSHKGARFRLRVSKDGSKISYASVRYWQPCAKAYWSFSFWGVRVDAKGRFHQHSGAEGEGGPLGGGETYTYLSGRFAHSGDAVPLVFKEHSHFGNPPPRGTYCAHVRVTGTGRRAK
jgi:hypothetical protein